MMTMIGDNNNNNDGDGYYEDKSKMRGEIEKGS